MARGRNTRRDSVDIWPGFVDALSTMLMVIIFLLAVFMLGQFFLSRNCSRGVTRRWSELELTALATSERQLQQEQDTVGELQMSLARSQC